MAGLLAGSINFVPDNMYVVCEENIYMFVSFGNPLLPYTSYSYVVVFQAIISITRIIANCAFEDFKEL